MVNIINLAKKHRKKSKNILNNIIYRWSPRSMNAKKLPESTLLPLFAAGSYAPSAFNNQPWRFYYSQRGSKSFTELLRILSPFNQEWCKNASFLIILASKKSYDYNGKFDRTHSFDTGAAWEAFAIEGVKRNLVVHGMSGFDYDKAKEYLKVGDDFQVECMIAVGQPREEIVSEKVSLRRPLKETAIKLK